VKNTEASRRYAKALFELATEKNHLDEVLNELRAFATAVKMTEDVNGFFMGPAVTSALQKEGLKKFFEAKAFSQEVQGLLLLLAEKRRFPLLEGIAEAFQSVVDKSRTVARGSVSSATTLFPEERAQLEATISRYTGQKAVLEYHEDKSLLGGLVAKVGSFTFDDTLETQLRLMKEALKKRRAN
jgi:F-type H+-transporting ATPase subunit delta